MTLVGRHKDLWESNQNLNLDFQDHLQILIFIFSSDNSSFPLKTVSLDIINA